MLIQPPLVFSPAIPPADPDWTSTATALIESRIAPWRLTPAMPPPRPTALTTPLTKTLRIVPAFRPTTPPTLKLPEISTLSSSRLLIVVAVSVAPMKPVQLFDLPLILRLEMLFPSPSSRPPNEPLSPNTLPTSGVPTRSMPFASAKLPVRFESIARRSASVRTNV